jgi:hypothetical protein
MAAIAVPTAPLDPAPAIPSIPSVASPPAVSDVVRPRFRRLVVFTGRIS